ncbi:hypothetical protein [Streptomyces sp. NPDC088141]|uniref:hypothetical protein n=1 Tax=Streptomyces sp. NPDC088141 TaxID=3155179 RepID=UPI00343068A3
MTTTTQYEIETSEADDGTTQPAEQLWTPCADDAADNGFIAHQGLFVTGIDAPTDDHLYPTGFLVLGHRRWADIIEAAAVYMAHSGWNPDALPAENAGGPRCLREQTGCATRAPNPARSVPRPPLEAASRQGWHLQSVASVLPYRPLLLASSCILGTALADASYEPLGEHRRQAGGAGHDGRRRQPGVVLLVSSPKRARRESSAGWRTGAVLRLRLVRDAVRHAHEPNDPYAENTTAFVVADEGKSRRPSRYPARRADALGFADAHTAPGHPHCPEHWWKVFRDQRTA